MSAIKTLDLARDYKRLSRITRMVGAYARVIDRLREAIHAELKLRADRAMKEVAV